jgi:hypothetical protein
MQVQRSGTQLGGFFRRLRCAGLRLCIFRPFGAFSRQFSVGSRQWLSLEPPHENIFQKNLQLKNIVLYLQRY